MRIIFMIVFVFSYAVVQAQANLEILAPTTGKVYTNSKDTIRIAYRCIPKLIGSRLIARHATNVVYFDYDYYSFGTIQSTEGVVSIPVSHLQKGDNVLVLKAGGLSNDQGGVYSNSINLVFLPAYASPYIRHTDTELTWDNTWGIGYYVPVSNGQPILFQVWASQNRDTLTAQPMSAWTTNTNYSFADETPGIWNYYWIKAQASGVVSHFYNNQGYPHATLGYLNVSPTVLDFDGKKQDTLTVNVSSNIPWDVYKSNFAPWFHTIEESGSGNGGFRVYTDPNSANNNRTTRFEIAGLYTGDSRSIEVGQGPGELSVLQVDQRDFVTQADSTIINFEIENIGTGNMTWYLSSDSDWLQVLSASSGVNRENIEVAVSPNLGGERIGYITIQTYGAKESPQVVTIRQLEHSCKIAWQPHIDTTSKVLYGEVNVLGNPASTGDELAIFRSGQCIGSGKIRSEKEKAKVSVNIQGKSLDSVSFALWDQSNCETFYSEIMDLEGWSGTVGNRDELMIINFEAFPDLALTEMELLNDTEIEAGSTVEISMTIENFGNKSLSSAIVEYFLSEDESLDSMDHLLGGFVVPEIPKGLSHSPVNAVMIPENLTQGDYFLLAKSQTTETELRLDNNDISLPIRIYLNDLNCIFGDGSDDVFRGGVIDLSRENQFSTMEVATGETITFIGDGNRAIRVLGDICIEEGVTIQLRQLAHFSGETLNLADTTIGLSQDPLNYGIGGQGTRQNSYVIGGQGGSTGSGSAGYVVCNSPLDVESGQGGTYPGGTGFHAPNGFCEVQLRGAYWRNYHHYSAGGGGAGQHGLSAEKIAFIAGGRIKFHASVMGSGSNGGQGGQGGQYNGTVSYFNGGTHRYGSQGGGGGAGGAGGHAGNMYLYSMTEVDTALLQTDLAPGFGGVGGSGGIGGGEDKITGADIPPVRAESGSRGGDGNHGKVHSLSLSSNLPRIQPEKAIFLSPADSVQLKTYGGSGFAYQWFRDKELLSGETKAHLWVSEPGNYHCELSTTACRWPLLPVAVNVFPDLAVNNLELDTTHYRAGDGLSYTVDLLNQGDGFAQELWTKVYLSSDESVSEDDILLDSLLLDTLSYATEATLSGSFKLPEQLSIGRHFLLTQTQLDSVYQEQNLENNLSAASFIVYFDSIQCYDFGGVSDVVFTGGVLDRSRDYTFKSIHLSEGASLTFSGSGTGLINVIENFVMEPGSRIVLRNGENINAGVISFRDYLLDLSASPVASGIPGIGGTGVQGGSSNPNPRYYTQARGGQGGVASSNGQDGFEQSSLSTGKGGSFPSGNGQDGYRSSSTLGLGGGGGAGGSEGESVEKVIFIVGGSTVIQGHIEGQGTGGSRGGNGGNGQRGRYCCGLSGGGGGGGAGGGGGHGGSIFFFSFTKEYDIIGGQFNLSGGQPGFGGLPGSGYSIANGSCAVYVGSNCSFYNQVPLAGTNGVPGIDGEVEVFELDSITDIKLYAENGLNHFFGDSALLQTHGSPELEYRWYLDHELIDENSIPTRYVTQDGNYRVEIINEQGCKLSSQDYLVSFYGKPTFSRFSQTLAYPGDTIYIIGERFQKAVISRLVIQDSFNINYEVLNADSIEFVIPFVAPRSYDISTFLVNNEVLNSSTIEILNYKPLILSQEDMSFNEDNNYNLTVDDFVVVDSSGSVQTHNLILENGEYYALNDTEVIPDHNFNGELTVPIMVTDGIDTSNVFQSRLEVISMNDAPDDLRLSNQTIHWTDSDDSVFVGYMIPFDVDNSSDFRFEIIGGRDQSNFKIQDSLLIYYPEENPPEESKSELLVQVMDSDGATLNKELQFFVLSEGSTLPVTLISFHAIHEDKQVGLEWITVSEVNNDFFEIQHSLTGVEGSFSTFETVSGNGTSEQVHNYTGIHQSPSYGLNFYRLKQVDFDGTFEYSNIINLQWSGETSPFLLYPVPTSENVTLEWSNSIAEVSSLELYDSSGKKYALKEQNQFSKNKRVFDIQSFPSGRYFLQFTYGSQLYRRSFMVE